MRTVKLLTEYDGHKAGDIIEVSNNVAFGLIDSRKAVKTSAKDFVKGTDLGTTKAFGSAPSRSSAKKDTES